MWMSLVEMKVWIRGRSESLIAFQAASMSWKPVRARPQMTGPWTSRAMAWTASKSPGEAIGKPASMMSTPSRASCCAISTFSWVFSEIPGDCSPSRRVVSKILTLSSSLRASGISLLFCASPAFSCGLRLRGRHALFPPKGEEEKAQVERELHDLLSLQSEHNLADVLALVHEPVGLRTLVERERLRDHRPDPVRQGPLGQW